MILKFKHYWTFPTCFFYFLEKALLLPRYLLYQFIQSFHHQYRNTPFFFSPPTSLIYNSFVSKNFLLHLMIITPNDSTGKKYFSSFCLTTFHQRLHLLYLYLYYQIWNCSLTRPYLHHKIWFLFIPLNFIRLFLLIFFLYFKLFYLVKMWHR